MFKQIQGILSMIKDVEMQIVLSGTITVSLRKSNIEGGKSVNLWRHRGMNTEVF